MGDNVNDRLHPGTRNQNSGHMKGLSAENLLKKTDGQEYFVYTEQTS